MAGRPTGADVRGEAMSLGSLETVFGLHVGLAHSAIIQELKRQLEPLQLTPKQTSLLWLSGETPGIAQADVARMLLVDRATMLGITNKLSRRGLIERRPSPNGGRRLGLHLTPDGQAMLVRAREVVARHEGWLTDRFSARELSTAMALLKRIYR